MASNVFINEIHYDNVGADTGEFVEVAGVAGTDLTGWSLVLYNGSPAQRSAYNTVTLSGTIADQQNGFGTVRVTYPANGIQNGGAGASGEADAVALVDPQGNVVQFLSYEGSFVAASGPAAGMTSVNVGAGIYEDGLQTGTSIGLVGSGTMPADFSWAIIADDTPGAVNAGQSFGGTVTPPAPSPGALSIADASIAEGDNGTRDIVFTVTRADGSAGAVSATWTLGLGSGAGFADAADLGAGFATTGTVTFADGATSAEIRLPIQGDTTFEAAETFTVTLSAPAGGVTLADASATGTIANDDAAPPAAPANVFINEIHYDNSGTDVGEAIEIAGAAGTDLTGYRLVLYNGTNTPAAAPAYTTTPLSGVIDDEGNGFGAVSFSYPVNGVQNGPADGIALVAPDGTVLQFLSYGGTITAAAGTAAAGLTSTDIGVAESPAPGVGLSLQLKGEGSSAGDFTWTAASDDSFGTVNAGQSFLSATGTGRLRIGDASVAEGDNGTTNLVFTVQRAGGSALAATVDYTVNLGGTATADDLADGAALSGTVRFAAGEFARQIVVAVRGDTIGEANETLSVTLGATTGNVVVDRAAATGTIVNDDPIALTIGQIQGESHSSAFVGQTVITDGIVTAVDSNGFYLQSATGDGNASTSDAVFVFTNAAPQVAIGDAASVRGAVAEFLGGAGSLTVTQLNSTAVTVGSRGNALPDAILIGANGILPPSQMLDDDRLTSFDPARDGIDFWESLEGMRVTLDAPQAVSNTNQFGETDIVVSGGVGATGINDRGGITISANADGTVDYNPEKIQIDDDAAVFAGFTPGYSIGDQLTSVTGVVNYAFANYEVVVTDVVSVTRDVTLTREVSELRGDANHLSIATYNLENLDASDNKFDVLADNIVYNLRAPDILAVQEVQDADGAGGGADLSGRVSAQGVIDAIRTQSGLNYAYVEVAPAAANTTGGEPGGNIRNGYLYNVDRVSYVDGSAALITGAAYNGSRNPLVAQFDFAGQRITAVDVHFTSRGGSEPLWGANQPAIAAGDAARTAQAAGVKAYIQERLAGDPAANIAVLGDWNGFDFEEAQTQLTDPAKGGVLTNLNTLLPSQERYSYFFEGNAQQLDNILVTGGLLANARYDAVHLNSQFSGERPTDHDPQLALLRLGAAPRDLALSNATVAENLPAGTVVGTLSATDTANDRVTYALTDDAGGLFRVDPATGVVTTTAALNREAVASYAITATATDTGGLSTAANLTIAVGDVNEVPVAGRDAIAVDEDATTANLWTTLLANDSDPDAGQTLAISAVDTGGTLGSVVFDAASQTLRYVADNDAFDALATGATQVDRFRYTVTDGAGLTSTATVEVTVTGVADGVTLSGGPNADRLSGGAGDDALFGFGGDDTLLGGGGLDRLSGGTGNDYLDAGEGSDRLDGDAGNDILLGQSGDDTLIGSAGLDRLSGGDGADYLDGGDDADRLDGDAGNDILLGQSGDDTLIGSAGLDRLSGGDGADYLDGGDDADRLDGDAGDDILLGQGGDDALLGGLGNDRLDGGTGNDFIDAGAGDDLIYASIGNDIVYGGDGRDRIVFTGSVLDYSIASTTGGFTATNSATGDVTYVYGVEQVTFSLDPLF